VTCSISFYLDEFDEAMIGRNGKRFYPMFAVKLDVWGIVSEPGAVATGSSVVSELIRSFIRKKV